MPTKSFPGDAKADPRNDNDVKMNVGRKTTVLVVAFFAAVLGGYFYFPRAPRLTEKDFILLADFSNTTGDSVFDDALRQGLSAKLEESTFLNIVSDQRVTQALRLIGQPADVRLNQDLARQVCEQTGSVAVIDGSIGRSEDEYVVGLKAVNCKTGETMAQEQVTSEDKVHVLAALGKAATEIRAELGESHALLSQFDTPLMKATTLSLEALQPSNDQLHARILAGFVYMLNMYKKLPVAHASDSQSRSRCRLRAGSA